MSNESPAAILFDEFGNPIGVEFDGYVYRLQVQTSITDGVNGPAAIKPPNTPATAADPALVVAPSPNSSFNIDSPKSTTVTKTNIPASNSSTLLISANTNRLGASVYNDSTSGFLYVNLGSTADLSDYVIKLLPLGYYEIPFGYVGEVNGVWSNPTGFARVSEFTP